MSGQDLTLGIQIRGDLVALKFPTARGEVESVVTREGALAFFYAGIEIIEDSFGEEGQQP